MTAGCVVLPVMIKIWPDAVVYEMIEANAANYAEGKKALFVTGLASEKQMEQVWASESSTSTDTDRM